MRQRIMHGGHRRGFQAGVTDRLTSKWTTTDETVNMSLLRHLRAMRARSRDFARNNEYGRKFFSLVRTHVVGPVGFTLKVDCRRPDGTVDKADSQLIGAAYRRWGRRGNFDVTGRLSETQFDALALIMVARDGEALVRVVEGRDRGPHRIQLQLLPGHLLDEDHNRDLANGHRIRMGVEFDAFMKPVAYHLRVMDGSADMHGTASQRYQRVDASEIFHLFIPEEIDQWRGVPWAYVALRDAKHLDQFDEAALVAANVGAAKMGFFQQKDPEAGPPMQVDGEEGDGYASDRGDFVSSAEPGTFDIIPDGYELKEYDPTYPNEVYDPFTRNVLRRLSTGLLVANHSLTGDLTQVNFSSIRAGTLDERDMWKTIQGWYAEIKAEIFERWLGRALIHDAELKRLPFTKFDKFNAPVFFGRRWDWVDPSSDAAADRESVALGVRSRAQIIRESGRDPDEVWAELQVEAGMGMAQPHAGGGGSSGGSAPAETTD
ncbi:phage portal protein [Sphingobium sp. MAH-33]|uniref:Phage portal protein n=3 Tax=Sphingobium TaxID=165695 RepID=A0ABT0E218_9SPHN|nr:phage portal protein [Sphingobium agri]